MHHSAVRVDVVDLAFVVSGGWRGWPTGRAPRGLTWP
jgi:hypothetical protein